MSHALTLKELPTSLGAFKPVGHVMVGLPEQVAVLDAERELHEAGFPIDHIIDFSAAYGAEAMAAMVENASEFAGFGYELTLMKRYVKLSREGCHWLLVYAPSSEEAERVKQIALAHGAPMAVKYHLLAIEDLI